MKPTKVLCAVIAACCLGLTTFGVGSATATSLCMVEGEVCSEGFEYPSGTKYHWHFEEKEIGVTTGIVSCSTAVMLDVLLEPGTPLIDEVTDANYAGCFSGLTECGEEVVHLPLRSEIEANTSTVSLKRSGGELEWLVVCGPVKCAYGAEKVDFQLEGGEPATLVAKEQQLTLLEGPLPECGLKPTFSASYVVDEAVVEGETLKDPPLYVTE